MATPLSAAYRITMTYRVNSLVHKLHVYVRLTSTVDPFTVRLSDASSISIDDAFESMANSLQYCLGMNASLSAVDEALLEHLVSGSWLPLKAVPNPATASPNSINIGAGFQYTAIFRGTGAKKVKIVVIEPGIATLAHSAAITAGGGAVAAYNYAWTNPITPSTVQPDLFMVGRDNNYITSFQMGTVATNRRARRRRGLA